MKSASRKVLLASILAHGLLFALLTPWLTMVAGAALPGAAEVQSRLVTPAELIPEPVSIPDRRPPPPENPPTAPFPETVPPEETPAEASLFDRPAEPSLSTAFAVPVKRSIAVRSAPNRQKETAPLVALAPPPVRTVKVAMHARRTSGPSRKAVPVKGNLPPKYPARARERAHEGVVLVMAHLDRAGEVVRVEILKGSGYTLLDREALRAVEAWRFRPALRNGVAIASRIEVPIRFRIS